MRNNTNKIKLGLNNMNVCLYIATHNKTKKKYFGKTTRWFTVEELQKNYHGSGVYWLNHLKKYGDDVTMEIYEIVDVSIVEEVAISFSNKKNIVNSNKWANLISENGLDGGNKGLILSEEHKNKISERMKNKVNVVDTNGNVFKVSKEEFYSNIDLVAVSKGKKRKKKKKCPHCLQLLYPSEEMYHFNYCNQNINKLTREVNCKFCNKIFKDNTGCKNHELLCVENPNRYSFECQYCGKNYNDLRNRNRHEKTCGKNIDREQYFCIFCDKEFKNNSSLTKHQNICNSNPNKKKVIYNCEYCNKEFKNSKINLIKHEKHYCKSNPNVEKLEFICECGKIYSDKGNFSKHIKKCNKNN